MANTTNFGWETPDDTDLVKDGAAAIRTLGSAIDTSLVDLKGGTTGQVLAKASNTDMDFTWATDASGIPATIFDAKGDLIAASAADTAARLAVGANGTVLTADSAEATGLKWAAVAGWNPNFSLINTGGTDLTGAATITVSGISGKNELMILLTDASSANAGSDFSLRFNSDTGTNYVVAQVLITAGSTYSASNFGAGANTASDQIYIAKTSSQAVSSISGAAYLRGCNAAGVKPFTTMFGGSAGGGNGHQLGWHSGVYTGSSTISSVSIISATGNFDNGKIWIYGA